MHMPVGAVRGKPVEKLMQILPRRGIGIFENDQTGAGMPDKNRDDTILQAGHSDHPRHLVRDFVTPAAARANLETFRLGDHGEKLSTLITQPSTP